METKIEEFSTEEVDVVLSDEEGGKREGTTPEPQKAYEEAIKSLEQKLAALEQQRGQGVDVAQSLKALTESLAEVKRVQATPVPEPTRQEDPEAWKKRIEELVMQDPARALEEYGEKMVREKIAPAFGQIVGQLTQTIVATSKMQAKADPLNAMVLEKWGKEVEDRVQEMVRSGVAGVDVYEKACKLVAANHLREVMEEQMKSAPSAKGAVPDQKDVPPGKPGKKVVKITPKEYELLKARGIDPLMYRMLKEE